MDAVFELNAILKTGLRFTIRQQLETDRIVVKLGDYCDVPETQASVTTFEEAVAWLREQVKARHPHSASAQRLLTN